MQIASMFVVFLCFCVMEVSGKEPAPSPARFTVKVIDEAGKPVTNAPISAGFVAEKNRAVSAMTDTNGLFVAECEKVMSGEAGYTVYQNVSGWYETHSAFRFKKIIDDRWQPWNPVVTAVVRKVINPIPMYTKTVELYIPSTNRSYGFDLKVGDWVTPVGKGVISDFVFRIKGFWNNYRDNDSTLFLTFSQPKDGIIAVEYPIVNERPTGSKFILPREAPSCNYNTTNQWRRTRRSVAGSECDEIINDLKSNQGYVFQIRSETNEYGVVTNALFGKIRNMIEFAGAASEGKGSWLKFTYYLNPTPNDRNLEFDQKKNLFKNLKSTEQVREP